MAHIEEPWYCEVMRLMLDENIGIMDACVALGIPGIGLEQALGHSRRRAWKQCWERLSREHEEHQASPAVHTKNALVGRMRSDAMRLRQAGKLEAAADIEFKLSKIEGWTSGEGNVNIFNQLTSDNMNALREKFSAKQ